jgi:hypothetical protein
LNNLTIGASNHSVLAQSFVTNLDAVKEAHCDFESRQELTLRATLNRPGRSEVGTASGPPIVRFLDSNRAKRSLFAHCLNSTIRSPISWHPTSSSQIPYQNSVIRVRPCNHSLLDSAQGPNGPVKHSR